MTIAACSTRLRPYRSPSFPYSGPETVAVSRYAVTTQERCEMPPRSPTIVGSAVETIVWSSAAKQQHEHRAPEDQRGRAAGAAGTASVTPGHYQLDATIAVCNY